MHASGMEVPATPPRRKLFGLAQRSLSMARKGGRRKAWKRVELSAVISVGALAAADVIGSTTTSDTASDNYFATSAVVSMVWEVPTDSLEGPLLVGLAHGDYSDSEIEEYLENAAGFSRDDLVGTEIARRKIRKAGIIVARGANEDSQLNDGKAMRIKLGFLINEGKSLKFWAYNVGSATLTTGTQLELQGEMFGFWT